MCRGKQGATARPRAGASSRTRARPRAGAGGSWDWCWRVGMMVKKGERVRGEKGGSRKGRKEGK